MDITNIQKKTSQHGKGAIETTKIVKDTQFRLSATVPRIVNWAKKYMVENGFILNQRNQVQSFSCTGQGTSYYDEVLDPNHRKSSARFLYSQSFLPGGGAYIWKPMTLGQDQGFASQESVPDGDSSEDIMEDSSLNSNAVLITRAKQYAVIPKSNIDQIAVIIEDHKGFVTGFNGHDGMFSDDGTFNVSASPPDWGHCVYVCGYELRDHKDQNGNLLHSKEKMLRIKNSWTADWGENGYGFIPECFVKSGQLFDLYVYAGVEDLTKPITPPQPPVIPPEPPVTPPKPFVPPFTYNLKQGDDNQAVAKLQEILRLDGEVVASLDPIGLYGPGTVKAVQKFMVKKKIGSFWERYIYPAGKMVGPKIRAFLNKPLSSNLVSKSMSIKTFFFDDTPPVGGILPVDFNSDNFKKGARVLILGILSVVATPALDYVVKFVSGLDFGPYAVLAVPLFTALFEYIRSWIANNLNSQA